jgi:hypothetical protein
MSHTARNESVISSAFSLLVYYTVIVRGPNVVELPAESMATAVTAYISEESAAME